MQEGWTVELRERMSGASKGDVYAVFISPLGRNIYTMKLALIELVVLLSCSFCSHNIPNAIVTMGGLIYDMIMV